MSQPTDSSPKPSPGVRQVTDPISHRSVQIHDNSSRELEDALNRFDADAHDEHDQGNVSMDSVVRREAGSAWWKDHDSNKLRMRIAFIVAAATSFGILSTVAVERLLRGRSWLSIAATISVLTITPFFSATGFLFLVNHSSSRRDNEERARNGHVEENAASLTPETAKWLNSLVHSLWPIINAKLFTSVSDMLEDSLQASMPKMIKAVRVADINQGTEPIRILGIHTIPSIPDSEDEDDDFINLEIAIAYRAQNSGSGLRDRARNMHLLMQFWAPGGIVLPIWVDLTGIIATIRLKLRLMPNPPFLSHMTLTLVGQPKLTLKCTPLAKNFLNVMDVPGLSSWLGDTIDAAMGMFVMPRSLDLDLKTMLSGREKMDTEAVGVIVIHVISTEEFRSGDAIQFWKGKDNRAGHPYVTLSYSKWAKPLWSTRVIENEDSPVWEETTTLLVTAADINAKEKVKLQLWDSDRFSADDILGSVEVPLETIMSEMRNGIFGRQDNLTGLRGEAVPGRLNWEVGYFGKTTLSQQVPNGDHLSKELKGDFDSLSETERAGHISTEEVASKTDAIIAGSPPSEEWHSGILSIMVIQIAGLEVEKVRQTGVGEGAEDEDSDDLPSAYCTIILNDERIYKTRTKMKDSKPYYDAGTERFVRDWRNTTAIIAVRDSRLHENDPLIGVVSLPLAELFKTRSQVTDSLPLTGGIGYGRVRFAMAFRSIHAKLPRNVLGWHVGTLEIHPFANGDVPDDLKSCTVRLQTLHGKGKLRSIGDGAWKHKLEKPVHLAVTNREASCLLIQFQKHVLGPDQITAFATLWLKDIPDHDEQELSLSIKRRDKSETVTKSRMNAISIGEEIGTLHLKVRFWPGLSGYHKGISKDDKNMQDVMGILDGAYQSNDNGDDHPLIDLGDSSGSDSSDDESSMEETEKNKRPSLVDDLKRLGKRKEDLDRKHRGLMQWGAARNAAWVKSSVEGKVDSLTKKAGDAFKHQNVNGQLEKEA